jgi:hypothetical protein
MHTADAILRKHDIEISALLDEWRRDEATLDIEVPSEDWADLARIRHQLENLQRMSDVQLKARLRDSYGSKDRGRRRHEGQSRMEVLP